jgi:CDP-diacylglycerol--glycerol-3-phosphate 3-phosphatidyltransferase
MSETQSAIRNPQSSIWNVPNQITAGRLVLSIVCFVFLALDWYDFALVMFVLAAGTDWVDGYWARRFNQITQLGRILDPFADKFIICGTFIFLAAAPGSLVDAWMAVLVMTREMLVTGLRSFFEERGDDFSATWSGKWKMVLQCLAAAVSIWRLTYVASDSLPPSWLDPCVLLLVWLAVVMTVYSGWLYIHRALQLLRQPPGT